MGCSKPPADRQTDGQTDRGIKGGFLLHWGIVGGGGRSETEWWHAPNGRARQ